MKLLNLDEILPMERKVSIGGKEYTIKQQTLGDLLDVVRRGRKAPKNEAEAIEQTIGNAKKLLPDCPEEVLRSLTANQLGALIAFANEPEEALKGEAGKE